MYPVTKKIVTLGRKVIFARMRDEIVEDSQDEEHDELNIQFSIEEFDLKREFTVGKEANGHVFILLPFWKRRVESMTFTAFSITST